MIISNPSAAHQERISWCRSFISPKCTVSRLLFSICPNSGYASASSEAKRSLAFSTAKLFSRINRS